MKYHDYDEGEVYDEQADDDIEVDVCLSCGCYFDFAAALRARGLKVEHASQVCNRCFH